MDYPVRYKIEILNAIQNIDLGKVSRVIQIFKAARAHERRIFVCGDGGSDPMAGRFLCDIVKSSSFNQSSRFRILSLSDETSRIVDISNDYNKSRVFVEQLKNFAEPNDVFVGICTTGNSPNVVNAIEYASWIGCRTIGITGCDGGEVARLAELAIHIPISHVGCVEDVHMIICHMIGYYFVEFEKPAERRV